MCQGGRVIGGLGRTSPRVTPSTAPPDPPLDVDERLTAAFRQHAGRVYAYARRHVEESQCDDVVSETFLVAWRRPDRIPEQALPWLLVVARNVIANQRRTSRRADQLWFAAVREGWALTSPSAADAVHERDSLIAAMDRCTRAEREALLLTAWDGLTPAQAAVVADCSVRAFTVRLHRARTRLRAALAESDLNAPCSAPTDGLARAPRLVQELS
jgi:RNA polymerase sigma factor (sigma-70 family)